MQDQHPRGELWRSDEQRAILAAVRAALGPLEGTSEAARAASILFTRAVPFAALKPFRARGARLGLAAPIEISPRLDPPNVREPWPGRLTAVCRLSSAEDVDDEIARLLRLAWSQS